MSFNREQFTQDSDESLSLEQASERSQVSLSDINSEFHSYAEVGIHRYRVAPSHDPKNHPFAQPVSRVRLPFFIDGKEVNKFVFISKVHGNPDYNDIVVEYVKYASDVLKERYKDEKVRKNVMIPITGGKIDGKWRSGIKPDKKSNWIVWAWGIDTKFLGRLELYSSLVSSMKKASVDVTSDDLTPKPEITFAHIDKGEMLAIVVNEVTEESKKKKTRDVQRGGKAMPLSDERMEELMEVKPLHELYENIYDREMFLHVKKGLENFDKKHQFNFFEDDAFKEIVSKIEACYPITDDSESEDEQTGSLAQNDNEETLSATEIDELPF